MCGTRPLNPEAQKRVIAAVCSRKKLCRWIFVVRCVNPPHDFLSPMHLNWDDNGYLVDGKLISNLRFADDTVLISTSTVKLEEMLNELNVASIRLNWT
ncbi:unnamed protein product [Heligmosomoides polygyrus]|uniref:Reverse transcriptase domain-containing protein n=1 Tax=Heligmosomoides polygyrus TaxID=6339 RepID=A0A183FT24_HELPZ|nr:unnamed protein product [Heligmosomoides polygyrus]